MCVCCNVRFRCILWYFYDKGPARRFSLVVCNCTQTALLEGQEYRDRGVELQQISSSETGMVEGRRVAAAKASMAATKATFEATKTADAITTVTLEGIMDRKVVGVMDIWMGANVKLLHKQGGAGAELAYFKNSSSLIPIRSVMLDGPFLIPDRHGKKQHRIDVADVMGEVETQLRTRSITSPENSRASTRRGFSPSSLIRHRRCIVLHLRHILRSWVSAFAVILVIFCSTDRR